MTEVLIKGGPHAGQTGAVVPWPGDDPGPGERFVTVELASGEVVTVHEGMVAEAVTDLKPRGVKRQWWLMPLDALAEAGALAPVDERPPVTRGSLLHALAEYQNAPSVGAAGDVVVDLIGALSQQQEVSIAGALDIVVQVFEHGAVKYSPNNWRHAAGDVDAFRHEYLSAICRHVFAPDGEIDPEWGLPHLAHACCGALMVLWHEMQVAP